MTKNCFIICLIYFTETEAKKISDGDSSEQRFHRCVMVVVCEFPMIMQEIMKQSPILPETLYKRIQKDKSFMNLLFEAEKNSLESLPTDGYTKLGITLIFKILRHYSNMFIDNPNQGWVSDPLPEDTEIGDDVQRMQKIGLKFRYTTAKTLSCKDFKEYSTEMLEIAARVDEYFKEYSVVSFEKRMDEYLSGSIDQEKLKKALEEIYCWKGKICKK